MILEVDVYQKELAAVQKRIEKLETKKDYSNTSYELETILTKLRVLKSIENYIWSQL